MAKRPQIEDEPTTSYSAGPRRQRPSSRRSSWSLAIGAAFIVLVLLALFVWPHSDTDPAPGGSAGSGSNQSAPPSQND